MNRRILVSLLALGLAILQGCATYTTPAAGVNMATLGDDDIVELMSLEPAAQFPARLAVVRVQSAGYRSLTADSYGTGSFSVVTTRDVESEDDFKRIAALDDIAAVAPITRLILPQELNTIRDLRLGAARLKADLLLIYTLDTRFNVESTSLGPLSAVTLGFLPNKEAFVSATTSALLVDVRTGFIYGAAESSARESQRTSMWNSEAAIDNARQLAERNSFKQFVGEFETLWKATLAEHVAASEPEPIAPAAPEPTPEPAVKPPLPPTLDPQPGTYTF
ncbi:hypothetical protein GCM10007421_27320 [Halopseudomonas oceani]|uniref:Lipoprotein n=1 Tax=Halopseudomonas oceani TaxID=1708783 RepID=A0A2P4ETT9_9GAMM|nr:hypothetical protein [Halopseudomonas oceani]POB02695.1 hypothetical protein C1949_12260 [Halopseudomonas oceani]GGE51442.1 hypothetical protein GCM10007421_27320 [Halopseudomonas oceani]